MMTEVEAKLLVDNPKELDRLARELPQQYTAEELPPCLVVDRYFDTPRGDVLRAGWAYRWRDASGTRTIALKSVDQQADVIQERDEIEQAVDHFPLDNRQLPDGEVARQLRELAVNVKKLHGLFQINNLRRGFRVSLASTTVLLVLDRVTVRSLDPAHETATIRFDEVEVELREGSVDELRTFVADIQSKFDVFASRASKFARGLCLLDTGRHQELVAVANARWTGEVTPLPRHRALRPSMPFVRFVGECLREQFEKMLAEEWIAWEGIHPEGVHRMRVAMRRLRAALRGFRKALPKAAQSSFRQEFSWVAATLGNVRDLDVYRQRLRQYASGPCEIAVDDLSNYETCLVDRWCQARVALRSCLESDRYRRLVQQFGEFLNALQSGTYDNEYGQQSAGEVAARLVHRVYKSVLTDGRAIDADAPEQAFHELRIDCKRLRYLIEFVQPIAPKKIARPLKLLKAIQETLGDYHDAGVAAAYVREYAAGVPLEESRRQELIALGQLIHAQQQRAWLRRADFEAHWRDFDDRTVRRRFRATLRSLSKPRR